MMLSEEERQLSIRSLLENKEKFSSIDIDKFISISKLVKQEQNYPVCFVDTINKKFQDSIGDVKSKLQNYLDSCQEKISLVVFDSIIGAQKTVWDMESWCDKDFEEAVSFVELYFVVASCCKLCGAFFYIFL